MNDVNELWSSPWRKLQKNLASGAPLEGYGQQASMDESWFPGASPVTGRIVPATSWLVRARSRKVRVTRIVQ